MQPAVDGTIRTARMLWLALLASLASYLLVLVVVLAQPGQQPRMNPGRLRMAVVVVAVGAVGGLLFFKGHLPSADRDPTRPVVTTVPAYAAYIVCWALAEAVGLCGFTLGLLLRSFAEAAPFFVVSAALLLWLRPRAEHFGGTA